MAAKDKLYIIKIGGNIIDDEAGLQSFLDLFAGVEGYKLLVHGGGKMATRLAEDLGMPQQMVAGRRITDAATLKIVTMVYAGYINKAIVAGLQARNCNALGLSGADGNAVLAHKRDSAGLDYGFAGDVDQVNHSLLHQLLHEGVAPVLCPITHDGKGQLLNTNADTIAQETAKAMAALFKVVLIYSFEKEGVLQDINDPLSLIPVVTRPAYQALKNEGVIADGMVPKLDNAFAALDSGVSKVIIGKAGKLPGLITGASGTSIVNE